MCISYKACVIKIICIFSLFPVDSTTIHCVYQIATYKYRITGEMTCMGTLSNVLKLQPLKFENG